MKIWPITEDRWKYTFESILFLLFFFLSSRIFGLDSDFPEWPGSCFIRNERESSDRRLNKRERNYSSGERGTISWHGKIIDRSRSSRWRKVIGVLSGILQIVAFVVSHWFSASVLTVWFLKNRIPSGRCDFWRIWMEKWMKKLDSCILSRGRDFYVQSNFLCLNSHYSNTLIFVCSIIRTEYCTFKLNERICVGIFKISTSNDC